MLQEEYYVLIRENNDNYPLFSWDQSSDAFGRGEAVNFNDVIKMKLSDPISPNYELVDYHKAPEPVVSKKIYNVLESLKIYGLQLFPVQVKKSKKIIADEHNYWFLHIWNRIQCLDNEKSDLELYDDGSIFSVEKLVLDELALNSIDLDKRLIFELSENTSTILIHKSIKDKILLTNPVGLKFVEAGEWYSDIVFE